MKTAKSKSNIYFIGAKQSDIACSFNYESDKFFTGAITIFGSDEKTSYNARNKIQLNIEDANLFARNEEHFAKHIAEVCHEIVEKDPKAVFMPYSTQYAVKVPAEYQNRLICANDPTILAFLNSKFNFKRLMKDRVHQADFRILTGEKVLELVKSGEVPHKREVVAQTEFGAGGKGTFIFNKKNANNLPVDKIIPTENYVVSDFVENLASAGVRMIVSNNEVAIYPPSIQTMKGPTFIGSDPFGFSVLDKQYGGRISREVKQMAQAIGEMFRNIDQYVDCGDAQNKRLRGCFGIDFLITDKPPHVSVIETNPRFTGASGLDNILSHMADAGSVFEHAYQAFYKPETDFGQKFEKILPLGQSIYAAEWENGSAEESEGRNMVPQNGREDGAYTYRRYIQKQAADYNVFEPERVSHKEFMKKSLGNSKFQIKARMKKIKHGLAQIIKPNHDNDL